MFLTRLDKYHDLGLLILRVGIGIMFMYHGYPKISGGVEAWLKVGSAMKFLGITMFPVVWGFMAAATEFFGGAAVGLAARVASVFLGFTMVVAATFKFGTGAGFAGAAPAIELLFVFIGLLLMGPGKFSIDEQLKK
jgi:putative oxidoreductase